MKKLLEFMNLKMYDRERMDASRLLCSCIRAAVQLHKDCCVAASGLLRSCIRAAV